MEDGIIYTYGSIDALVVLFDGLRLLFDPATTTFFSGTGGLGLGVATTLAAMIALIGTMNQYVTQQRLQAQGPLMGLFIYALVAIPTIDRMYVSDINTGKTLPIYDVPIGLGIIGYGMSLISFQTSQLMETAFQTVAIEGTAFESTMTGGNGFLSPVKTLYALRANSLQELDEALLYNMYSYTKYCLHRAADEKLSANPPESNVFKPDEMKTSNQPFTYMMDINFISPNHLNSLAEFMDPTTGDETFQSCSDIRNMLSGDASTPGSLNSYLDTSTRFGASRLRNIVANSETITQRCADGGGCADSTSAITTAYESAAQLLGGVGNARSFYRLRVMRDFNALVSGAKDVDPDSAMMAVSNINEAIQTAQLQEAIEGETFINFMMPAINFIIMLFYALFPLAMLIMITKGMGAAQYLGGYLLIGIWGYSIIPVATAINYITIANTREAVSALITMDGYTPFAYDMVIESAANYLSVGSNLLAASPVVTLAVITGSVFALTSVASSAATPAGSAGSIANRSTPQAHSQMTELSLSPYMTDSKGMPGIAPSSVRSMDYASKITATSAYTNGSSQAMAVQDVKSAREGREAARQELDSKTSDMIKRVSSGNISSSEQSLVEGYQKIGRQMMANSSIDFSGYDDSQTAALETAYGYVGTANAGLGGDLTISPKKALNAVQALTDIDLSSAPSKNSTSPSSQGQTNPAAPPGTDGNPTTSMDSRGPSSGGGGFSVTIHGQTTGGVVTGTRETDEASNGTSKGGRNEVQTGSSGDVVTTGGTSSTNAGGVRLNDEQQRAITQHQADLQTKQAAYEEAKERQRTSTSQAVAAEQYGFNHDLNLGDVQAYHKFANQQQVIDYFNDQIDEGLSGKLTPEQLTSVKNQFLSDAQQVRDQTVPGGADATSMLIGGFGASDVSAMHYKNIAGEPADTNNHSGLTADQAKQVAGVLSQLDSNLFKSILNPSQVAAMDKNTAAISGAQEALGTEGQRVEAQAATETSNINYSDMGVQSSSNLTGVQQTVASLQSQGGNAERVSSEYGQFFSDANIQQTIDSNAQSLGVEKGTKFNELNESQQNQVLAEQTNQALSAVMGLHGVDAAKYSAAASKIAEGGINQPNNFNNEASIDGGQKLLSQIASDFNSSLNDRDAQTKATETAYQEQDGYNRTEITKNSGFAASGDLIKNMAGLVPGATEPDPSFRPDRSINPSHTQPLSARQEEWNSRLKGSLLEELSNGTINGREYQNLMEAHSIQVGSDTTPFEAYTGLVGGNVTGNYNASQGATNKLLGVMTDKFFGETEIANGSNAQRANAAFDGVHSPVETISNQRQNLNMTPNESAQYIASVRDNLEALGADVSSLTDEQIQSRIGHMTQHEVSSLNPNKPSGGYATPINSTALYDGGNSVVNEMIGQMLETIPNNVDSRAIGRALQQPMIDIENQRGSADFQIDSATSATKPANKTPIG